MEEAQKKARNLITAAKEKNDVISNALKEARREALNLINSTTTRNPDLTPKVWNMADYEDHRQPSLPPEGESQTAEGNAHPQANPSPGTRMTSSQTNPRLACTLHCMHTIIAKTLEEEQKKTPDKANIVGTRNTGEN